MITYCDNCHTPLYNTLKCPICGELKQIQEFTTKGGKHYFAI